MCRRIKRLQATEGVQSMDWKSQATGLTDSLSHRAGPVIAPVPWGLAVSAPSSPQQPPAARGGTVAQVTPGSPPTYNSINDNDRVCGTCKSSHCTVRGIMGYFHVSPQVLTLVGPIDWYNGGTNEAGPAYTCIRRY